MISKEQQLDLAAEKIASIRNTKARYAHSFLIGSRKFQRKVYFNLLSEAEFEKYWEAYVKEVNVWFKPI